MDYKDFNEYLNEKYANIPEDYLWWIHYAVECGDKEKAIRLVLRLFRAKSYREDGYELHSYKPFLKKDGNTIHTPWEVL
jgi:hypothetical protein